MAEPLHICSYIVSRLISGGQTGVDRAALDVALELGIPAGGWCPAGRRSASGPIPARYPLVETEAAAYPQRTRQNIRDSDATLVITRGEPSGGTLLTIRLAERMKRPCLVIDFSIQRLPVARIEILEWLRNIRPAVLNVAGPRASESPGLGRSVRAVLRDVLAPPPPGSPSAPWPPKRPRSPKLPGIPE
ncbi:MAG TPA: putative molybdenum carrier protein [Candidatus Ozemobacteraceae bacterium]|nr:putative molybdenum carrier protein [Candidatus Ozemobacteraceae bacterium]HQG27144.1 putative molybdenum carrier protein [Candidatus Ozemobacteraceae bacterium]